MTSVLKLIFRPDGATEVAGESPAGALGASCGTSPGVALGGAAVGTSPADGKLAAAVWDATPLAAWVAFG